MTSSYDRDTHTGCIKKRWMEEIRDRLFHPVRAVVPASCIELFQHPEVPLKLPNAETEPVKVAFSGRDHIFDLIWQYVPEYRVDRGHPENDQVCECPESKSATACCREQVSESKDTHAMPVAKRHVTLFSVSTLKTEMKPLQPWRQSPHFCRMISRLGCVWT